MRRERRWQECTSVPRLQSAMTWLSIAIPLMIAALAVAVVPVLVGSFRHDNAPEVRFRSPAEESEFWHHLLGHHSVEDFAAPSHLVEKMCIRDRSLIVLIGIVRLATRKADGATSSARRTA